MEVTIRADFLRLHQNYEHHFTNYVEVAHYIFGVYIFGFRELTFNFLLGANSEAQGNSFQSRIR